MGRQVGPGGYRETALASSKKYRDGAGRGDLTPPRQINQSGDLYKRGGSSAAALAFLEKISREAAKEYSPRRKSWVSRENEASPEGAKETPE